MHPMWVGASVALIASAVVTIRRRALRKAPDCPGCGVAVSPPSSLAEATRRLGRTLTCDTCGMIFDWRGRPSQR